MENHENVVLAPMVRGSELAFRAMVRRYGVRHCYSPMLRAAEVVKAFQVYENRYSIRDRHEDDDLSKVVFHEDGILLLTDIFGRNIMKKRDTKETSNEHEGGLLTVQLCGCCPETLYDATRILIKLQLAENIQLFGIDLNLGCPQKCAENGCFGAFLAENQPELALECITSMRRAIDSFRNSTKVSNYVFPRLSCKIRLLESDDETILFTKKLQKAGCELLAVHCRHRVQKHNGEPDLEAGRNIIKALSIPVLINGSEIYNSEDVYRTLEKTNAHSIMIARAFLTNPRLLVEPNADPAYLAAEYLDFCELHPPPSALYIQKHFRWIFRKSLQPECEGEEKRRKYDYKDWRVRLWSFLVRPYLQTIYQFRQVVVLYVKLNGSKLPKSLQDQPDASFRSIRRCRDRVEENLSPSEIKHGTHYQATEIMVNLFQ